MSFLTEVNESFLRALRAIPGPPWALTLVSVLGAFPGPVVTIKIGMFDRNGWAPFMLLILVAALTTVLLIVSIEANARCSRLDIHGWQRRWTVFGLVLTSIAFCLGVVPLIALLLLWLVFQGL